MTEFYEDDGIEIDDASLLAAMATNNKMNPTNEGSSNNEWKMETDDVNLIANGSTEEDFLENFRTEVAEVYLNCFILSIA